MEAFLAEHSKPQLINMPKSEVEMNIDYAVNNISVVSVEAPWHVFSQRVQILLHDTSTNAGLQHERHMLREVVGENRRWVMMTENDIVGCVQALHPAIGRIHISYPATRPIEPVCLTLAFQLAGYTVSIDPYHVP